MVFPLLNKPKTSPPHTLLLEACPRFERDTTQQGCLGVVSGSGKVQLTYTVEENKHEGGLFIDSETKSNSYKASTEWMARIQAPLPLIETLTMRE